MMTSQEQDNATIKNNQERANRRETFSNIETINLTDYKYSIQDTEESTEEEHIGNLVQCVARINNTSEYIVKIKTGEENDIKFMICDEKTLKSLLDIPIEIMKDAKAIDTTLWKLFKKPRCFNESALYNGYALLTNNPDIYQLFTPPPKTEYIGEEVKKVLDFIRSRIINPNAFNDELYTIKNQFKNIKRKACRFYVHYEDKGGAGKSFTSIILSKLYGEFSFINIDPAATTDRFNAWMKMYLFLNYEEAQTDNYNSNAIQRFIKIFTSDEQSYRAMQKEYEKGRSFAIGTMNTNDPGLYGINGEKTSTAVNRRLVVCFWKHADEESKAQWKEIAKIVDDPRFRWSLYNYIVNELEIPDDYDIDGFYDPDFSIEDKLREIKPNSVAKFNTAILDEYLQGIEWGNTDYTAYPYPVIQKYEGDKTRYYYISTRECYRIYKEFCRINQGNHPLGPENFQTEFLRLGWSYNKNAHLKIEGADKYMAIYYRKELPKLEKSETENSDEEPIINGIPDEEIPEEEDLKEEVKKDEKPHVPVKKAKKEPQKVLKLKDSSDSEDDDDVSEMVKQMTKELIEGKDEDEWEEKGISIKKLPSDATLVEYYDNCVFEDLYYSKACSTFFKSDGKKHMKVTKCTRQSTEVYDVDGKKHKISDDKIKKFLDMLDKKSRNPTAAQMRK